jgi:hypothetical protein
LGGHNNVEIKVIECCRNGEKGTTVLQNQKKNKKIKITF